MSSWIALALASGVLNAFWTSRIKPRVRREGALPFAASMRIGVALLLLVLVLPEWKPVSPAWWAATAAAGITEVVSLWALTRGARKDYYAAYAFQNTSPVLVAALAPIVLGETVSGRLWAGTLMAVGGAFWMHWRGHFSAWGLAAAVVGASSGFFSKLALREAGSLQHAGVAFLIGGLLVLFAGWISGRVGLDRFPSVLWGDRWLIAMSFGATACFYTALRRGPLSAISPLVRVNLLVGFLLSYWTLGEQGDWKARLAGGILLVAGIVLVAGAGS